jgi:carbamoyltransferase
MLYHIIRAERVVTMTNIIGISSHFHDAACCLLQDGEIIAAAEEERFSRRKHDPRLPRAAFKYCLEQGGISVRQVDCISYYEQPVAKLSRQISMTLPDWSRNSHLVSRLDARRPEREIREILGYEGRIHFVSHHEAHAASAYYFSGFEDAAILTIDGVGEWETTTYGLGKRGKIKIFESVNFPDSLGLLYSTITQYLGFEANEGEYKVMGLAAYGRPVYADRIRGLVVNYPGGQYRLNLQYFDFQSLDRTYADKLCSLLGEPARQPEAEIKEFHWDVACSLQVVLEEIIMQKVAHLWDETRCNNLCIAGGVALNCVANARIRREGPFSRIFIQPAAGDAGGCLGAAALAHQNITGKSLLPRTLEHVYLGPGYSSEDIALLLDSSGIDAVDFRGREGDLMQTVANELAARKVVGWFQGRMEFGPRALGARSILADPRDPQMRDRINELVKKRESFRPFAPSVLESRAAEHFEIDFASDFMLETTSVISQLDLPAITHVDGSARVQTVDEKKSPRFANLLKAFEDRSHCPILLNTSFNMRGEPIVCSPIDALVCFIRSGIDMLVLQDFLVYRSALGPVRELLLGQVAQPTEHAITYQTYTFL